MNEDELTTIQQFSETLKRQRESIVNYERISQEIGLKLTEKQSGHIAGMLLMSGMIIEQIDEYINKK